MSLFLKKLREAAEANSAPANDLPANVVTFPDRGRRLDAQQIADEFYGGHRSAEWVTDVVPCKVRSGHRTNLWWETDVRAHLEDERRQAIERERQRAEASARRKTERSEGETKGRQAVKARTPSTTERPQAEAA